MKIQFPFSCLLLLTAMSSAAGQLEASKRQTTIYRDAYGAPHVFAATDANVLFGMAYALAEDDWPLIEENYVRALGRSAEREGEAAVTRDWMARALEISRFSIEEYKRATPRMRGLLDAYAAGLNAYLAAHPSIKPLSGRVESWYPLALIRYKYYLLEFVGYAGLRQAWTARLLEHGWPVGRNLPRTSSAPDVIGREESPFGSNEWAVAPSRTASGHALLLINPHQSFVGVQRYGEVHLNSREGLRFSGLTVFGFLLPYMGNNQYLGWAYTDNMADRGDLYAETFDDVQQPLRYRYGTGHRDAQSWTDTIRVLDQGRLTAREYKFWKTHHGPIVGLADDNRPLSIKLARYEEGGWFDQWDAMIRSHTMQEWKQAVARLNVAYMNNMYADRAGNIGYIYGSAVPRRDTAFAYAGIVDGSDSRVEWQGFHTLEELPQVFNPSAGYLLNTNSTPMTATHDVPYKREQFPRYMIGSEGDNARAVSSRRVLESMADVTFDEFARAVWDTRLSGADAIISGMTDEWNKLKAANAADLNDEARALRARTDVAQALDRLSRWDRRADTASVETTWLVLTSERRGVADRRRDTAPWPWSRALAESSDLLQKRWGRSDVAWGMINRLQRPLPGAPNALDTTRVSLQVGGAPGGLGSVFTFHSEPFGDVSPRIGVSGNSFVKVIEFGPTIRARSVLNFGQRGDPASPHFFDQASLYAKRSFKEAWFSEQDVKRNAVRTYVVSADN
ncbi:MAG: penicillin acylase family protein [Verrucomicrobia bacterium]|nr:penicillin acylase family protein [Verrucomicrobiota bacterium]